MQSDSEGLTYLKRFRSVAWCSRISPWGIYMVLWSFAWKLDGARWQYSSMDSIDGMLSMFYNKWD